MNCNEKLYLNYVYNMVYWLHSCSLTISCMYSYFIMSITLKVDFITACMCRVLDSSCGFFSVMLVHIYLFV